MPQQHIQDSLHKDSSYIEADKAEGAEPDPQDQRQDGKVLIELDVLSAELGVEGQPDADEQHRQRVECPEYIEDEQEGED